MGTLRSYDQYANLVLQDTAERIYSGKTYADIQRGIFLIRGENLVFLGRLAEDEQPTQQRHHIHQVPIDQVLLGQQVEIEQRERVARLKERVLMERGYGMEMEPEAY